MRKRTQETPENRQKRRRSLGTAAALLAVLLAVLTGINLLCGELERRNSWRVDCSFNALTTQSETTLAVLEGLTRPVHIYAVYARGEEDQPLLELLNRYAAASPLVTWEQTDLSLNPSLLTRYRGSTADSALSTDSLIVTCEETGRFKVLSYTDFIALGVNYDEGAYEIAGLKYESSITSAIRYVTRDTIPRAMILQGHGEMDEGSTGLLASLLASNSYDVAYFTLNTTETELTPDDLLLVLSPQRDLNADEMAALTDFTAHGGSILFTCDYTDPIFAMPNWLSLLRSYGFLPQEGVVIASQEEKNTYYSGNRMYLIPIVQRTEITADLVDAHTDTLLLVGCRGFALPQESDRSLTTETLLLSGARAYARRLDGRSIEQQEGDAMGPFALALQARRITAEGYISRAVVLGSSSLLTSADIYAMTDTQAFIVRTAEFLLDTEPADLGIVAKTALRPGLSARSVTLGVILTAALPFLVALAAMLVLRRRQ